MSSESLKLFLQRK